ncbi:MAG: 2-oxoglutarate dehydrogenase E1 component [Bdellovibrionales bacterium]|nr:2-oxoglutarate dehydrogenase E1 component [Bdellovibrionales bacterium]
MARTNMEYIENLFHLYQTAPEQVDPKWQQFFEGVEFAQKLNGSGVEVSFPEKELGVYNLIQIYRDYGHLKATLDPLGLQEPYLDPFDLRRFGLAEADLDQSFHVGAAFGHTGRTLRQILDRMEDVYCGTISAQLAECPPLVRQWFRREFEEIPLPIYSAEEKKAIYCQLARTETLEKFIHTRYVGTKRFSIEGGDALIPMLEALVTKGTALEVEEIVIGMAHRGRINVLANFMDKAIEVIFSEFEGTAYEDLTYDGDVKYHLGYSADKETPHGPCHISLAFNPSHLEAVDPVVCGMARAKQRRRKDTLERKKVVPVLVHGDAAFAGQGVVGETFQLSQLDGYKVGGTIHVILNNQVGFTTDPIHSRSTRYSSDISKTVKAPVILVNGDDVEACVRAMDMAIRFRQEFKQDVVIDLVCYRRFGHNEGDEPSFTQPVMYQKIKRHPTPCTLYREKVTQSGAVSSEFADGFYQEKLDNLQIILDEVRANPPTAKPLAFGNLWKGLRRGKAEDFETATPTGAKRADLERVAQVLTGEPTVPFHLFSKIKRLVDGRKKMVTENQLDWAMCELLAYGSLCLEGIPVRVSGQDCKRGTFTHRQAVYFDEQSGQEYNPLSTLSPDEGEFCIYNSPLSEMAVLGFEYGNSVGDPTYLTVWEAQFGDFANGAQIIIDQFLASGEEKWLRSCGLTLLLPHGYEGQGPEHSSARLERFLTLCAQTNMQVCNITTPANFFHVLRRQMKRDFRKPLVVMSPKSLLRHPKVISRMEDLEQGHFQEVLDDGSVTNLTDVEKVILCSGKLYYDLEKAREENPALGKNTAIIRLEQLYPFPAIQLVPYLNGYINLKRVIWAQEEPKNMGAWHTTSPRLRELLDQLGLSKIALEYVGRTERASPATGSPKAHQKEQSEIIQKCFS